MLPFYTSFAKLDLFASGGPTMAMCPPGFQLSNTENACYSATLEPHNHTDAVAQCGKMHPLGRLAVARTMRDAYFIKNVMCSTVSQSWRCWIGLVRNPSPSGSKYVGKCTASKPGPCGNDTSCACDWSWIDTTNNILTPLHING